MDGIQLRDTKIVLVEGMPGTGKSSIAQWIQRQLSNSGRRSYWRHEEQPAHPVRLFYEPERHPAWDNYRDEALTQWERYTRELRAGNQIAVLDAAVLQNHARIMLLHGCDWPPILDLVHRIEAALALIQPIWIYLKPTDIEQNFENLTKVRGQRLMDIWLSQQSRFPYATKAKAKGFAGFLEFWREFDALADQVFEELAICKLEQSVAASDWEIRQRELLDYLDLPLPSDPADSSLLNRFAGQYTSAHEYSSSSVSVAATQDGLLVTCNDPSIDVPRGPAGCYHEVRLLPAKRNRFHVEGWPHEVEFVDNDAGTVIAMRVNVSESGWKTDVESFVRDDVSRATSSPE